MKLWSKDNNIEIYSEKNEGKYGVAERIIKTLKNICLSNIWLQYQKIYLLIKSTCIEFDVENNDKHLNLKLVIMYVRK